MADISVSVLKKEIEKTGSATEVVGGPRDREVLDAATRCASALYKDLHVFDSAARVARFKDTSGDSWTFRWAGARCPESALCLTGLTDTPHSTTMDVQLPSGDLVRILGQSLQWFKDPIQLGSMNLYVAPQRAEGAPVALVGGVIGSGSLSGFGLRGVIETAESASTMRVLLGKRHCLGLYPKDLYFTSRRFANLTIEAGKLGLAELLADVKKELRRHRYGVPATDLEILLSELASREPTTEIVRDLVHTAIWPVDSTSRFRMQYVRNQFFRDTDAARRNLGVLTEEMLILLGDYRQTNVQGGVPDDITSIAEGLFKFFQWREDDVSIEDMALLFVRELQFTESALKYLEMKASSRAAEALQRTGVPPEFESARDRTVQRISERLKSRGDRQ